MTYFKLSSSAPPLKLTADPQVDIFRRLAPSEIPPAVNTLKSSASVVTVLSNQLDPALEKAARALVLSLGLQHNRFITEDEWKRLNPAENNILLIGYPQSDELFKHLPAGVGIRPDLFSLNKSVYRKSSDAFFGVFNHPFAENRITALFMPLSAEYADVVAAKITHYGRYSYLAFKGGRNQAKGLWPVQTSPLVYRWDQATEDR